MADRVPEEIAEAESRPELEGRIDRLQAATDDAAGQVRNLYVAFLSFGLYLAITVGATTDEQLLREAPVRLPLVDVGLPLVAFYWIAPLLFVLFHFNLLMQLYLLSDKLHRLDAAIRRLPDDAQRERRATLSQFVFSQMLVGAHGSPLIRVLLNVIAWNTFVVLPIAVLLLVQIQFLPYHDPFTTWWQRCLIVLDLLLLWLLWLPAIEPTGRLSRQLRVVAQRRSRRALRRLAEPLDWPAWPVIGLLSLIRLARTLPARIRDRLRGDPKRDWRLLRFQELSAVALLIAFLIAAIPGRFLAWPIDGLIGERGNIGILNRNLSLREKQLVLQMPEPGLIENIGEEKALAKYTRGLDLRGRDLRYADLELADLRKADLRESASLQGANLGDADLQGANLSCDQFDRCTDLHGADLDGSDLRGATLLGADLQAASLRWADFQGANLRKADLRSADLWKTDLRGANLVQADLRGANLGGANLGDASLSWAVLQGASLLGADLQGAYLNGADLRGADLMEANLQAANLSCFPVGRCTDLQGANLNDADLRGASLVHADLRGANLAGANLWGADLRSAQLWRATIGDRPDRDDLWNLADLRDARIDPVDVDALISEIEVSIAEERTRGMVIESLKFGLRDDERTEVPSWHGQPNVVFQEADPIARALGWAVPTITETDYDEKLATFLGDLACGYDGGPVLAQTLARRAVNGADPVFGEPDRLLYQRLARRLTPDEPEACPAAELPEDLRSDLEQLGARLDPPPADQAEPAPAPPDPPSQEPDTPPQGPQTSRHGE